MTSLFKNMQNKLIVHLFDLLMFVWHQLRNISKHLLIKQSIYYSLQIFKFTDVLIFNE